MVCVKDVVLEVETLPGEFLPEVYEFIKLLKAKTPVIQKKSAFGCLSEYGNPSRIHLENQAWEREAAKKYAAH